MTITKGAVQQQQLILQLTAISWIIAKVIGWKVWVATRLFPLAPLCDVTYQVPSMVHLVLFMSSLAFLFLLIVFPQRRWVLACILAIEATSCILDLNRLQPWEYQYMLTISIFLFCKKDHERIPQLLCFLFAATYLYAGIQKFNDGFLSVMWARTILSHFFHFKHAFVHQSYVYHLGYALGLIEALAGLSLLFRRTSRAGAVILILMHILILFMVGPWGLNNNTTVWSWNILMVGLLYLLFVGQGMLFIRPSVVWQGWGKVVVVVTGLLPMLGLCGYWDGYLSFSMFSCNGIQMKVIVKDKNNYPALVPFFDKDTLPGGTYVLNIQTWATKEMNSPPYPEVRVYRQFKEQWLKQYPSQPAHFVLFRFADRPGDEKELQ